MAEEGEEKEAPPELRLTVSFRAMQRCRTTIEDFVQSYFPYAGLDPVKDLFAHLDVLVWLEATIYQLDEDNEMLARKGQLNAKLRLLEDSPVAAVLRQLGLLDADVLKELQEGDEYWRGERELCAAMLQHAKRVAQRRSAGSEQGEGGGPGPPAKRHRQESSEGEAGPNTSPTPAPFTQEEVLHVHERKSFDYRVLHLVLRKLAKDKVSPPDPVLTEFLRVDELLVDIGDDLTDYEDDVEANSFNVLRAYVCLHGRDAPLKLVERIGQLEQRHGELLKQLPNHLQQHYWSRHKQAINEGGGEGSGRWVFPPLILDEEAFRQDLDEEA